LLAFWSFFFSFLLGLVHHSFRLTCRWYQSWMI
jgi:hypothetical protein